MPEIKVLPKEISELIAAGEVVERPASVIKELVENSIDAGADNITVEIQHGGITYMRITDNGCGIEKNEVPTAVFTPCHEQNQKQRRLKRNRYFGLSRRSACGGLVGRKGGNVHKAEGCGFRHAL